MKTITFIIKPHLEGVYGQKSGDCNTINVGSNPALPDWWMTIHTQSKTGN